MYLKGWVRTFAIFVTEFRGVVFFALFDNKESGEFLPKEAAPVIKIASSRMDTQSERHGCEFANWIGVSSPQDTIIHNCSTEWLKIKEVAEKQERQQFLKQMKLVK
ncbi:dual specificity protein phosphatase PHS1 isoform X2 [Tanacetum coccineum]